MGLGFDNRLESVAYAHTAADLHVRLRFQNRAGLKIVGAASDLRCTRCCVPRNEFDSLLGWPEHLRAACRQWRSFRARKHVADSDWRFEW